MKTIANRAATQLASLKMAAFLSILFMIVYGSCNWITAHRNRVGTFYFEWERHIPFIPIFIIPYMSIDLLFVAAPFLCRSDRERRTLSNRIVAGILIAGVCFLLFPFRFAFERPYVEGPLSIIFNNFRNFDQPFNQFPSLHITLRTILAVFYVQRFSGLLKWMLRSWFSLIGFSTLFTYQHHFIDVVGGFVLGALCVYWFADESMRAPVVPNPRVGCYYIAVAAACVITGIILRPIGLPLLYPAGSFAMASTAYFGMGPGVFRKKDGRLPPITWVVLWPVLLAQRLSLRHYASKCDPWNKLTDRVWIGRKLTDAEAMRAVDQGVTAVLDLTGEFSEAAPFLKVQYRHISVMDLTAPTAAQLNESLQFITQQCVNGIVYVHCKAGYSRTAAVAGAYLLATGMARSVEQAVMYLQSVRPTMVIRPEAMDCLRRFPIPAAGELVI